MDDYDHDWYEITTQLEYRWKCNICGSTSGRAFWYYKESAEAAYSEHWRKMHVPAWVAKPKRSWWKFFGRV